MYWYSAGVAYNMLSPNINGKCLDMNALCQQLGMRLIRIDSQESRDMLAKFIDRHMPR